MIISANFMVIAERVLTCYDFLVEARHIFTTAIRSFSAINSIIKLTPPPEQLLRIQHERARERVANGNKNKGKVLIFHLAKKALSEFFSLFALAGDEKRSLKVDSFFNFF